MKIPAKILNCDFCYGKGVVGYASEDGDFDFEYCDCNPNHLIIENGEIINV